MTERREDMTWELDAAAVRPAPPDREVGAKPRRGQFTPEY